LSPPGSDATVPPMKRYLPLLIVLIVLGIYEWRAEHSPGSPAARTSPSRSLGAPAAMDSVSAPGLGARVEIVTDRFGIPHVHARTRADLYYAWGFVTARDRLWQIEQMRAQVEGRQWRWFGNRTLTQDGGAQLFELSERAERIWERDRDDPIVAEALGRYAEGVNTYLALCRSGERPWPREFGLIHAQPADWRASDAYRVLFGEAFLLDFVVPEMAESDSIARHGEHWLDERRRFEDDRHYVSIPDTAAARMYAGWPRSVAATATASHSRDALPSGVGITNDWLAAMAARDPEQRASNAFAVGPRRSASGSALLANDPHLPLTSPGTLHVIHLSCDEDSTDAMGAYCPGMPALVSGRNRRVAWGLTVLSMDNIDLYADTLSADRRSVRYGGEWVRVREGGFDMRYRALGFLDLPPFGQKRRYTPHGPVIRWDTRSGIAVSVRWAGRDEDMKLGRLIGLEHSRDVADLTARWRTLVRPTFNIIAADIDGHVRYQAVGAEPRRGFAPIRGLVPGDGHHEWLGQIAPDSMPAWDVPPGGFVANGNNLPVGASYPEPLPRFDWRQDRARRLAQRLGGDTRLTMDDMASVQNDVVSRAAAELAPLLIAHADSVRDRLSPRARAALDTLRAWRFDTRRWYVAPTLYRAWWATLWSQQGWSDVPGFAAAAVAGRAGADAFHDPLTGAPVRPAFAVATALDSSLVKLEQMLGPELASWTWGRAHVARFAHGLARIDPSLEPPLAAEDGDNATPSVGASYLPRTREVRHGPVWRQVVDLAHPGLAWGVVPPGNAAEGPHSRDLLARWVNHRYVPLAMDPAMIAKLGESELVLTPRGTSRGRSPVR